MASSPPHEPDSGAPQPRKATLLQVIGAVFWSFLGVRKGNAMRQDAVTIKPAQVIIVGIILGALLVVGLLSLVRFIIGQAH